VEDVDGPHLSLPDLQRVEEGAAKLAERSKRLLARVERIADRDLITPVAARVV
jgi:hypothetical protein